jgi:hypothetical protein
VGWIGSKKPLRPLSTEELFNQWNQSSRSSSVVVFVPHYHSSPRTARKCAKSFSTGIRNCELAREAASLQFLQAPCNFCRVARPIRLELYPPQPFDTKDFINYHDLAWRLQR